MSRSAVFTGPLLTVAATALLGTACVDSAPPLVLRGEREPPPALVERMERLNVPGLSIAVLDEGRIAWARGYGLADATSERRVTPETLFQAASISKPVAALAALRLVQDGVLALDEDVNHYLEQWRVPDNEFTTTEKVTLRRLLNHTAGTTVWGFPGYPTRTDVPSPVEVLDGGGNTDPIRVFKTPGESWRYSGGGYTVMQLMMTDATAMTFPRLLSELVLEPAGMTRSTYEQPLPADRLRSAATGHRDDGTPVQLSSHTYPEMAAAGLWTTPSDLAQYAIVVQAAVAGSADALLSQDLVTQMLTAGMNDHGLGPVVEGGGTRFGHGGSNAGFRASFTALIREGRGVFVMTNSDSGGELAREIVRAIGEGYGWAGF